MTDTPDDKLNALIDDFNVKLDAAQDLLRDMLVFVYNRKWSVEVADKKIFKLLCKLLEHSRNHDARVLEIEREKFTQDEADLRTRVQGIVALEERLRERETQLNERDAAQTKLYSDIQLQLIEQRNQTMLMQDILNALRNERMKGTTV